MSDEARQTQQLEGWIERLKAGDESARRELLNCAYDRLVGLTRKMLRNYPRLHRWEETGDVMQNASLRLYRSLAEVHPAGVVEFLRLAALNIRRELLDMAKHYYGPQGQGTTTRRRSVTPMPAAATGSSAMRAIKTTIQVVWPPGPSSIARWKDCPKKSERFSICCGTRA